MTYTTSYRDNIIFTNESQPLPQSKEKLLSELLRNSCILLKRSFQFLLKEMHEWIIAILYITT